MKKVSLIIFMFLSSLSLFFVMPTIANAVSLEPLTDWVVTPSMISSTPSNVSFLQDTTGELDNSPVDLQYRERNYIYIPDRALLNLVSIEMEYKIGGVGGVIQETITLTASNTDHANIFLFDWTTDFDAGDYFTVEYIGLSPYDYRESELEFDLPQFKFLQGTDANYQNLLLYHGYLVGYDDGASASYQTGYSYGYNAGFLTGSEVGYNNGYSIGFNAGSDAGYSSGYDYGYNTGQSEGYITGYLAGREIGRTEGYGDGYAVGLVEGKAIGYDDGLTAGETIGYADGYEDGIAEVIDDPGTYLVEISNDIAENIWFYGLTPWAGLGYTDITSFSYDLGFIAGVDATEATAYEQGYLAGGKNSFMANLDKWLVPAIIIVLVAGGFIAFMKMRKSE